VVKISWQSAQEALKAFEAEDEIMRYFFGKRAYGGVVSRSAGSGGC
jgi:hypothetical protein